jgi:hypothetical protein
MENIKNTIMKDIKRIKFLPFLLLIIYFLLVGNNESISFEIKIILLSIILLISIVVVFYLKKRIQIENTKIYIFLFFIILSIAYTLYYLNKIEN